MIFNCQSRDGIFLLIDIKISAKLGCITFCRILLFVTHFDMPRMGLPVCSVLQSYKGYCSVGATLSRFCYSFTMNS
jgi:hypothetical protein